MNQNTQAILLFFFILVVAPIWGQIKMYQQKVTGVSVEQQEVRLKSQIRQIENEIKWGYGLNQDPYHQRQILRDLIAQLEIVQAELKNPKKG